MRIDDFLKSAGQSINRWAWSLLGRPISIEEKPGEDDFREVARISRDTSIGAGYFDKDTAKVNAVYESKGIMSYGWYWQQKQLLGSVCRIGQSSLSPQDTKGFRLPTPSALEFCD